MIKFTDYEGHRLRIMPTHFTRVQTKFQDKPIEVVYANVTWLREHTGNVDLGNVAIFPNRVIAQIKGAWVGRPIVGTLVKREHPRRHVGYPPAYMLDDLEGGVTVDLISVTTKRNDPKGVMAITFVLEEARGLPRIEERALVAVAPELERTLDRLEWPGFTETLAQVVAQPHGRVHVHFAYQRRG